MSLELKSKALKDLAATYNSDWFLGDLSFVMHAGHEKANDQLGKLSSPLRQLYYLAGLNVTSDSSKGSDFIYTHEKWNQIVVLLNEIEEEYDKLLMPSIPEEVTEDWKRVRKVAIPSFLSYFNQGPLNYEEQVINWTSDLYSQLDKIISSQTGLTTQDFIQFYDNLDQLNHRNFQAHSTRQELLRTNWDKYTKIEMGVADGVPDFIKEMGEQHKHIFMFMSDKGIKDRFYPKELVSDSLSIEKVNTILKLLSTSRKETDFLYYTATKPGNPLLEKPILYIGDGMFQVFEVKQVIHAIDYLLEQMCTTTVEQTTKYIAHKGNLLEDRIVDLFSTFFKEDFELYRGYYIDGNEQDILILWKKYAFIIEAKGYSIREPFRNPEKAFIRIKDDFNSSIGYGYKQTLRVEKKFIDGTPMRILKNDGTLIKEVETTTFDEVFSIIVNLNSFGQVQCDLSTLLTIDENSFYPWAVKLDDLEIFLLTMIAKKKDPTDLVDFLIQRETLHGKLICSDELEICGGYLTNQFEKRKFEETALIKTTPDMGDIFDEQYRKGMGFKNERLLHEKQSGRYIFW